MAGAVTRTVAMRIQTGVRPAFSPTVKPQTSNAVCIAAAIAACVISVTLASFAVM